MISAVIFDLDGTLLDTERLSTKAWLDAAAELDTVIASDLIQSIKGHTVSSALAMLSEGIGDEPLTQRIWKRHRELFEVMVTDGLTAKPGAIEALTELREMGAPLALATSTGRPELHRKTDKFDLMSYFDVSVCGNEVERSKPAPDIFLRAADRLGVPIEACAVIEDSPTGVRAGHASGAHVYMVPEDDNPAEELAARCEAVLGSLSELIDVLRAAGLRSRPEGPSSGVLAAAH